MASDYYLYSIIGQTYSHDEDDGLSANRVRSILVKTSTGFTTLPEDI